jgi:energy-coupling factor transporter ATP-binding protein EcfA2
MISIQGLSFRFQDAPRFALHNVDLEIAPGEFVIVTGPSGCGKSTLALAIGGYLFRQYDGQASGAVNVAGMDVRQMPIYDVAEVVGLVQQNPEAQFCTLTVQDEVAFGLENRRLPRQEIQSRIEWALEIVGATHLVERSLATLSGGEKQKVAIAAMMAAKPQVLIFDEPTSNLDPTATAEVFDVISHIRAKAGITVIVFEHKTDYLRSFKPRLLKMEEGTIVYDGPMLGGQRAGALGSAQAGVRDAGGGKPVVATKDLHLGYNGHAVLRDVSIQIGPGEFVVIMGDNGSGKTTLLLSLLGLVQPSQGCIKVLGRDARQASVSELARQVGLLFQNPDHQLFAESVWDEATFALRNFEALDEGSAQEVEELLARCGLGNRLQDHPYRLSYGEKRRLNLVSVLAHAPRLFLLDEVLIGQDPENARFLLELLQERVGQGGTVIMVSHNPQVASLYASRLLFFNGGRVVVDAPVREAFQRLRSLGQEAYLP